jgi:hypothetical protein
VYNLLEKNLPFSSGLVQLSQVKVQNVLNVPSDQSLQSRLSANLANVMQDSVNNRFIGVVSASAYPYFTQGGYVNLEDGALFDTNGKTVGYTLYITDLIALLQQLNVSVVRNNNNQAALKYRTPASKGSTALAESAKQLASVSSNLNVGQSSVATPTYQPAQVSPQASLAAPSYQPVVRSTQSAIVSPSYQPDTVQSQSSGSSDGSYTPQVASAPVISQRVQAISTVASSGAQGNQSSVISSNPQIAALQQQDIQLTRDMQLRQNQLKTETIAHRKQVLQNAILTDSQQIAANTKQIAALQGSGNARSTVLGRLGAKSSKKKNKKS